MIKKKHLTRRQNKDLINPNQDKEQPKNPADFNTNISEIPEFLRKTDNEQHIEAYIRMRQRHIADGAVFLNLEADDIADQNIELYENKGINIEPPHINENLAQTKEYFVESSNRNQFRKISGFTKIADSQKTKDEAEKKKVANFQKIEKNKNANSRIKRKIMK